MAFLQIKSTNPNLSYILMKNPDTGMVIRKFRQGFMFGYYTPNLNNSEYNVYFKDGDDEVSFKTQEEEFEHNDSRRFNSPIFIQGCINDFFKQLTNLKEIKEDVSGYDNKLIINQLYMFNPKYIDLIQKYYTDINIEYTLLNKNNYRLEISSKRTISDLINLLYIVSMFYHCLNSKDVWVDEAEIQRYVKIFNNIDSPYFIKYVIKSRIIRSQNKFDQVKSMLDHSSNDELDIRFGDTSYQRAEHIKAIVDSKTEIVDIGCNDMRSYGFYLAKQLAKSDVTYHAIDIDPVCLDKVQHKAEQNGLKVNVYDSFETFIYKCDKLVTYNFVMSEIFEHIELEESEKIITYIIEHLRFKNIIITTPNRDFNVNYIFDEGEDKRLEEHIFEMNSTEFQNHFVHLLKGKDVRYEFLNIGDLVNGISATQSILISRYVR